MTAEFQTADYGQANDFKITLELNNTLAGETTPGSYLRSKQNLQYSGGASLSKSRLKQKVKG